MNEKPQKNNFFWILLFLISYAIAIGFSFNRVYIKEDYPTFYSEEEMPDSMTQLQTLKAKIGL